MFPAEAQKASQHRETPISRGDKGRGGIGCRVKAVKPHLKVYSGQTQSQGGKQDYPVGYLLGLKLNLIKAPAKNLNIYYLSYLSKEPALQSRSQNLPLLGLPPTIFPMTETC